MHDYANAYDLEGPNAIREEDLILTGSCSLKVIGNALLWAERKKDVEKAMKRVTQYLEEPCTFLVYIDEKYEKQIKNLKNFGFIIMEILPGGHGKYEMVLMYWTFNPEMYTNDEELT